MRTPHPHPDARVREALARTTGTDPDDWFLLTRGRHAMQLALAHLDAGEVITQPMTCLTAVAPVMSAGHEAVHADIDPDTLALDPASAAARVSARTRAVVGQHSFGVAAPLEELRELVAGPGGMLLEDSAHCLAELGRDAAGRPVADVSVHSFGVDKILPTRTGGALWLNPEASARSWYAPLRSALEQLPAGGARRAVADRLSPHAQRVARHLGAPGARALGLAARTGLVDQVIMDAELSGRVAGRPRRLDGPGLEAVHRHLPGLEADREHRRQIAQIYREGLAGTSGVHLPGELAAPGRVLVRFPLLLASTEVAERVFTALQEAGLVPGRWYRPLLFPGPTDPTLFGYRPGECPAAEDVAARILNLPTAAFTTPTSARQAVEVVRSEVG